jgi:hypothetical protein
MNHNFKQIPLSEIGAQLPALRRPVQLGKLRNVLTHYGEVLGFLLPLEDVEKESIEIANCEEISFRQLRSRLSELWHWEGDCIFLTVHTRRVLAFLSPKFKAHLSLPVIGNTDQIFG